ncbi:MAG: hypothetical protein KC441_00910 [Anaerolineales bacterium]|nr:hypothetical protein [Anaerolineales bacterium]
MSDFVFTPSAEQTAVSIPFYEDAEASAAPYYSSTKTVRQAKTEVTEELVKLGAGILAFQEGHFGQRPRKRYGYQIQFNYRGAVGVIRVAGLPMRSETSRKVERVRVQALLNVRDWLKASVTQAVFSPGSNPLMMNLLVDGRHTLAEYIQERGALQIPAVSDNNVVDGEFVE